MAFTQAALEELVRDAENTAHRLTDWERGFMANIASGMARHGAKFEPSERQEEVLQRIEKKLHGT